MMMRQVTKKKAIEFLGQYHFHVVRDKTKILNDKYLFKYHRVSLTERSMFCAAISLIDRGYRIVECINPRQTD